MANHVRPIVLTDDDRAELERLHRASSTPAGLSRRVRAVLLMVQGVEIAERVGYTVVPVSRIRRRFAETGVAGLSDRPKSGRPPTVTARKRAQIVALVHRLWQGYALQPHWSYSTTFVARNRIDSGTLMPSAFAVLRLTTRSNLVGCSTGKSPGMAPFRILST